MWARPFFKLIVPDDLAATFAPQVDVDSISPSFWPTGRPMLRR